MQQQNWQKEHWTNADYAELLTALHGLADPAYRRFHENLVPGVSGVLGVRLPQTRGIAKAIAQGHWREYLACAKEDHYEEILLQGLVIAAAKMNTQERLERIASFVPKIHCWAVCDSFAAGLHFTKKNKETVFAFLQNYWPAEEEYAVRFALVMLMDYYLEEAYLKRIFQIVEQVKKETYYVKMAVAWLLSMAYVKFPAPTLAYLQDNTLDDFTYRKALQKIIESNRVSQEEKERMRAMKTR